MRQDLWLGYKPLKGTQKMLRFIQLSLTMKDAFLGNDLCLSSKSSSSFWLRLPSFFVPRVTIRPPLSVLYGNVYLADNNAEFHTSSTFSI